MWRYLILNALWFSILSLVHFFGTPKSRHVVLGLLGIFALWAAVRTSVDPWAWFFYGIFSLAIFWSVSRFRLWALQRSLCLQEDLAALSQKVDQAKDVLSAKNQEVEFTSQKADEIGHLYDKVKEMSESLDSFEVFLLFTEALGRYFRFDSVKLGLFSEPNGASQSVQEFYEIGAADLRGVFDRDSFLKDKKKWMPSPSDLDQKILKALLKERKRLFSSDPAQPLFLAYPIFLEREIFAALLIYGVRQQGLLPILSEYFLTEMQRVKLYERIQNLAITDGLTGVAVRRHLVERLEEEVERSKKFNLKLSYLMIDVDHFKGLNDDHGHLVGDGVLREVAQTIRRNVREVDLVGRYGGEEFGVILVETDPQAAMLAAERIRRAVEERNFRAYDESLKVTVSVGCATLSGTLDRSSLLVEAADGALYQAKHEGRNRVRVSSGIPTKDSGRIIPRAVS